MSDELINSGTPPARGYLQRLRQLLDALPHTTYRKGDEERAVLKMEALSQGEIWAAFEQVQRVVKDTTGITIGLAGMAGVALPEINIPVRVLARLDEAGAKRIAETLQPIVYHADKTANQRNTLAEILGIDAQSSAQGIGGIHRSNSDYEEDTEKPMGYTFWIKHTRTRLDAVMPNIAQKFNRALGGPPLFHMMRQHNDSVRIWINEADIDTLLANPNRNKLAGILASYAGNKAHSANTSIGGFVNRLTDRKPRER